MLHTLPPSMAAGRKSAETDTDSPTPAAARSQAHTLTPREASVLGMIMQGSTNRETGAALGISARTVEFHRANIMLKFGARNLADLMRMLLSSSTETWTGRTSF